MTDAEAKELAQRTHAVLKSHPALDLLIDIAHDKADSKDPNARFLHSFIIAAFDIIGENIDRFEELTPSTV